MKKQCHHLFIVLRKLFFIAVGLASIALVVPAGIIQAADAGYALHFDGNSDMVQLAETVNIIGSGWENTKSVNLWVKPTGTNICTGPDAASCPAIFEERPHFWGITIGYHPTGHHAGQDRIWVWNTDGSEELIGIEYTPDEWVNIALVHDGGLLRAYKNGLERGSVTSGATLQASPTGSVLYLGGVVGGDIWLFNGEIDEVRIWNRALSATEIGQSMHQTLIGNEPGLVAYYQMSDGSGTTLTDDSQHDWNGALLDGLDPLLHSDGTYPLWVASDAFVIPETPAAPTNLEAAPTSPIQVDLTWTDNSTNEADFEIERCSGTGCSNFSLLTSVLAGTQAYPDTGVNAGTTYCYQVRATNSGGTSAYTNIDCAITPYFHLYLPIAKK